MTVEVVAIHQPNFFPWLGYFDKIARADRFVVLDDAQFPKTGGTWINRVRCFVGEEPRWVTAAVDRGYHGHRTVREMRFAPDVPWRKRLLASLESGYRRAPHYGEVLELLSPLIAFNTTEVAEFNINALGGLCAALGLSRERLVLSSALQVTERATQRLIQLCQAVGGRVYMCGGGADGYQDDTQFEAAGLKLLYQSYEHPRYPQFNRKEFVPGLSVIDALMNCGPAGTAALVAGKAL